MACCKAWGTTRLNFGISEFLFNIFLAELFFMHNDINIANFADDSTPYLSVKNVEDVTESLERA